MISTKHKIIIIVFGILALTYVVMYFIEQNAEAKKVERFAEDSDDDEELYEEPSKPSPTPKVASKPVSSAPAKASKAPTASTTEPSLASIMNQVTSYVQNKVSKEKQTSAFKDLFSEKNLSKLMKLNSQDEIQTFVDSVISEDADTETFVASASFVKEKVESIKSNLKKVQEDVEKLYETQLAQTASVSVMPKPAPATSASVMPIAKPETEKGDKMDKIEGFENVRYSFATY
jgi:hypothetical protein